MTKLKGNTARLLELLQKGTYKLTWEESELAARKEFRSQTGKRNPRPKRQLIQQNHETVQNNKRKVLANKQALTNSNNDANSANTRIMSHKRNVGSKQHRTEIYHMDENDFGDPRGDCEAQCIAPNDSCIDCDDGLSMFMATAKQNVSFVRTA